MAAASSSQYRTEHVAETPRGWRVRMKAPGPRSKHLIAIAYPPGRRKKGSGRPVEILHPAGERNPCPLSKKAKQNPQELVIFANPRKVRGSSRRNPKQKKHSNADLYEVVEVSSSGTPTVMTKPLARAAAKKFLLEMRAVSAQGRTGSHHFMRRVKNRRNPAGQKKANPRRAKHRHNPITETEQAVHLFEIFHGKEPREIVEKHVSAAMRKDYTALGKLIAVGTDDCGLGESSLATKWDQCPHLDFSEDHVTLASSPDGRQLYAIGGNQNLDKCLAKFEGVDPTKDFMDLGDVAFVTYEARKIHDNFEPVEYTHRFGGHGNTRPRWMYDRLKKQIFFLGGEYLIDIQAQISPGIEG